MDIRLKRLSEQVLVITGATSGIGLVTARMAARRGARLVLVSRNAEALAALVREFEQQGREAIAAVADVADQVAVQRAAQTAIERFGGFDTWINNAGVSVYGRLERVPMQDHRRLVETNFWGVVNGSLAAAEHLKKTGGALINVGSQLSDHAVPLQGMYCASKHAVKGFTDALRQELALEDAPVSVTLVKPAGIDSMFVPHARNYMDVEPKLPPPVYAPETVAEAILNAAEHPMYDVFVGAPAKVASVAARAAPALFYQATRQVMYDQQRSSRPVQDPDKPGNLHAAGNDGAERGSTQGPVMGVSLYTRAAMQAAQLGGAAIAGAMGLAGLALMGLRRPR